MQGIILQMKVVSRYLIKLFKAVQTTWNPKPNASLPRFTQTMKGDNILTLGWLRNQCFNKTFYLRFAGLPTKMH